MLDEVLAGRFRITALLGSGGMGQVWAAEDVRMRRDVAVKVVHPQYGAGETEARDRFEREVQLAARLTHQNVVTVHDWGEVSVGGRQTLYLVMELVDGTPLDKRFKGPDSVPWPLAAGWGAQIAQALHAAHRKGVVHRDIKPANVLLTPDGTLKVLDFGIAKFLGDTVGARKLTAPGDLLGTPAYMSPEQIDARGAIDRRSDLYSLGCLLYHAVTGRPPFHDHNQWSVVLKHKQETPTPPSRNAKGLPPALEGLIMSLLEKCPEDRPFDAAAVHETLMTILVNHELASPGEGILDIAGLGHGVSVAGQFIRTARAQADDLLAEARDEAARIVMEAEEVKAEAIRMAKFTVEKVRNELELLVRHTEYIDADIDKITGPVSDDEYYQLFKLSIDGRYPTPDRFGQDVEATYGITLLPDDALRMVLRFTNRHTAELEEDHIA
ncbi:serine/threonine-protein kinase [Streptomyces longisporus]|uniref:non-specific serine/threonine protein kinase n=1 Tax=Streptomyces longisporus TaxID=1948 RepID=A0ABP6A2Q4_STRLO